MDSDTPRFTSPLPSVVAGHEGDGLTVNDSSACRKWRLVGDPQAVALGCAAVDGDKIAFSVSPGEWMVVDASASTPAALAVQMPPVAAPGIRVVDVTHLRAGFRISGIRARDALSRLCSLELTDRMFPNESAARTLVAKVATEVIRLDQHSQRSYLLLVSRSFGRYLYDAITDSTAADGRQSHPSSPECVHAPKLR